MVSLDERVFRSRLGVRWGHEQQCKVNSVLGKGNMENPGVGWVAAIVIGGIAGWLAEMFMKSNMGVLMNIILGIVGAIVANLLLGLLGLSLTGWLGYLVAGFIGACILIAVACSDAEPRRPSTRYKYH